MLKWGYRTKTFIFYLSRKSVERINLFKISVWTLNLGNGNKNKFGIKCEILNWAIFIRLTLRNSVLSIFLIWTNLSKHSCWNAAYLKWFENKYIYCYWCTNSFQIFDSISYPYFFYLILLWKRIFLSYFPRKRCVLCHLTKTGHCFRAIILNKKRMRLCCKTL